MPDAALYDASGAAAGRMPLSDAVFGVAVNRPLLHQAVTRQQANARQGTHDTKTRGEVAGSTRKMWRQKGTGRARQGAKRAPHWRGGGIVFGPHPRDYRQAMPKKMRIGALRSALAAKAQAGQVVVLQELRFDQPSTRQMKTLIEKVAPGRSALLVLEAPDANVQLSARNLQHVTARTTENLNVLDILRHEYLVLSAGAVRVIEGRYGHRPEPVADAATTTVPAAHAAAGAGPVVEPAAGTATTEE